MLLTFNCCRSFIQKRNDFFLFLNEEEALVFVFLTRTCNEKSILSHKLLVYIIFIVTINCFIRFKNNFLHVFLVLDAE